MEKIFANESEFKTKEELLDIVSVSEWEKKVFVLSKQQDDFTVKIIFIFQLNGPWVHLKITSKLSQ